MTAVGDIYPKIEHEPLGEDSPKCAPNAPHPSLEFPPLYFALDGFPQMKEMAKSLYAWRWRFSYPLQKRLPFSKFLRHYRIYLTYGELLFILPLSVLAIVCIVQSLVNPDVVATGKTSRYAVIAALLFGQKNSYLTMMLGIPFDRAVLFHQLAGYVALATGLLHAWAFAVDLQLDGPLSESMSAFFDGPMDTSGTIILAALVIIYVTSVPYIRARLFEVFHIAHLMCLVAIILGTALHTGAMVPVLVFGTTGLDFLVRKVYMALYRYPNMATLKVVSDTVVQLRFPKVKGFDYNPGQYVYIAVPELSAYQFHPFSIATSPHELHVSLFIRRSGNWTDALHRLAQKKSEVAIQLDGPYGNFAVDLADKQRYNVVLMVGGGIGFTPLQSLSTHLLRDHEQGNRELKLLKLIWVARDPILMETTNFYDQVQQQEPQRGDGPHEPNEPNLAEQLFAQVYPGKETDEDLEALFESFDFDSDSESGGSGDTDFDDDDDEHSHASAETSMGRALFSTGGHKHFIDSDEEFEEIPLEPESPVPASAHSVQPDTSPNDSTPPKAVSSAVLDVGIFLTNTKQAADTLNLPGIERGRPDLEEIFRDLRRKAINLGEKRVAVCVCGPQRLIYLCRKACIQLSDDTVRFDSHIESFGA